MAYYLVSEQGYRIVQLSENEKELWLEKLENNKAPIIRLHQFKIDWSNVMQRDIELTAANGERIRRQLNRNELKIVNVYISAYPPVDEFEYRLNRPYPSPENNKTSVFSTLLAKSEYENGFERLMNWIGVGPQFVIKEEYSKDEVEEIKKATLESAVQKVKKESVISIRIPFITYALMIIQIAVFFWLETHGGSTNTSTLIKYGAKLNPLIYTGEWWRLITPVFLHIGFLHLAMNTLALYYLGISTERIYGNGRFIFIYLFAGFTGFISSFLFSPNLSAGASGAIVGCLGALLYFSTAFPKIFFRTMGINVIFILVINLVYGFISTGIDNAGHLGGLVGGFLAAGIVHFPKKKKLLFQFLFLIMSIIIVGGSLSYGFSASAKSRNLNSYLILASNYTQNHQYKKAYELLKSAEKISKQPSAQIYFELSYNEIKMGILPDAKTNLLKAVKYNPTFHEADYNLALIYLEENDYHNAKKYADRALKLKPNQKNYADLVDEINGQIQSSGGG